MPLNTKKIALIAFLAVAAIRMPCTPSLAEEYRWIKKISPEIFYTHVKKFTSLGPLHVHILKIDMSSADVSLRPAIATRKIGSLERVDMIAKRENAIAAVNGSFFETRRKPHLPVGIMVADGKVINKSLLNRTAMGITGSGGVFFGIPKIKGEALVPATGEKFSL